MAKWPESNFKDVVKVELDNQGADKYKVLVMSAPTVDITNLDTNIDTEVAIDIHRQKIVKSSLCNLINR